MFSWGFLLSFLGVEVGPLVVRTYNVVQYCPHGCIFAQLKSVETENATQDLNGRFRNLTSRLPALTEPESLISVIKAIFKENILQLGKSIYRIGFFIFSQFRILRISSNTKAGIKL